MTAKKVSATEAPQTTTLDTDTTKPATNAPGDAPADTTDPTERASSVTPNPGPEAIAAGTVNSVVPVVETDEERDAREAREAAKGPDRVEEYPAYRPDGTKVTVRHNIDTGETEIV